MLPFVDGLQLGFHSATPMCNSQLVRISPATQIELLAKNALWLGINSLSKNSSSFYSTYSDDLLTYNARDCCYTARIYSALKKEERWAEARTKQLYKIHTKLSQLASRMHDHGIWVHQANRRRMINDLGRLYAKNERAFLKLCDVPGMRCTPGDLRSLLYKRHESVRVRRFSLPDPFDPRMFTDETMEKISVDRSSLLLLLAEGSAPPELVSIIDAYWAAEETWKTRTFLTSKKTEHAIGPDNMLRPGWNSCGTDTMRFSCRDPNVMQWEKSIRCMLGAAPGRALVGMDKAQLEIRVGELVSQDDYLWTLIQTGDVYSADVRAALGLDAGTPIKAEHGGTPAHAQARQDFKIIRLASQYMAGLPTVYSQYLQSDRNVSFNKVKLLHQRFHRVHADGLIAYAHRELAAVSQCGYSEGRVLFGRRYYPRVPPITEVANWPIQRTASEMMNIETLDYERRLKDALPTARIIIQMHDAVVTDCKERDVERVKKLKAECFTTSYTIAGRTRPFPIDLKTGMTWDKV